MENRTKITQKEKQLLSQDICARLPYEVKVFYEYVDDLNEKTYGYSLTLNTWCIDELESEKAVVRPYLRSLSSMTKEEAKKIATLHEITDILSIKLTDKYIDITVDDGVGSTERRTIWYDEIVSSIEIFDWLNKNHFDYRGLIPKGLAIEVTKENNPYK